MSHNDHRICRDQLCDSVTKVLASYDTNARSRLRKAFIYKHDNNDGFTCVLVPRAQHHSHCIHSTITGRLAYELEDHHARSSFVVSPAFY